MQKCVLSVEDYDDSVFFLNLAYKKAAIVEPLVTLGDGESATKYLLGKGAFADRERHPFPCLLLLDIKLPKDSGFEILKLVRKTPSIKTLPVVILTNSPHPTDILMAHELGADHYLVKPSDLDKLAQMLKMAYERWVLCLAKVPTRASPSG